MKWETRQSVKADYNKYIHKLGDMPKPLSTIKELILLPEPKTLADLEWVESVFSPDYSQKLFIATNNTGVNMSNKTFYSILVGPNAWTDRVYFCTRELKDLWDSTINDDKVGLWDNNENDPRFIALYKCLTREYYDD